RRCAELLLGGVLLRPRSRAGLLPRLPLRPDRPGQRAAGPLLPAAGGAARQGPRLRCRLGEGRSAAGRPGRRPRAPAADRRRPGARGTPSGVGQRGTPGTDRARDRHLGVRAGWQMSDTKLGRILMTGAAGGVGTFLRGGLAELGWQVRGFDLVRPDEPGATEWVVGDVGDAAALDAAMRDVDVVVHLAGIPVEDRFERILKSNIDGTYQVFDAAVRAGVPRILTASSNHAVGYYERSHYRDEPIGVDVRPRPDTYYGVSKVFMEAIGSFYAD